MASMAPVPATPLEGQFTRFPSLSADIRTQIYGMIDEGKIVSIYFNPNHRMGHERYTYRLLGNTAIPRVFHINQESRAQGLREYRKIFSSPWAASAIYFNVYKDTLRVNDRCGEKEQWDHFITHNTDDFKLVQQLIYQINPFKCNFQLPGTLTFGLKNIWVTYPIGYYYKKANLEYDDCHGLDKGETYCNDCEIEHCHMGGVSSAEHSHWDGACMLTGYEFDAANELQNWPRPADVEGKIKEWLRPTYARELEARAGMSSREVARLKPLSNPDEVTFYHRYNCCPFKVQDGKYYHELTPFNWPAEPPTSTTHET